MTRRVLRDLLVAGVVIAGATCLTAYSCKLLKKAGLSYSKTKAEMSGEVNRVTELMSQTNEPSRRVYDVAPYFDELLKAYIYEINEQFVETRIDIDLCQIKIEDPRLKLMASPEGYNGFTLQGWLSPLELRPYRSMEEDEVRYESGEFD